MLKNKKTHIIILVILVCAAYLNSLPNAFISDDIPGIVQNSNLGKLADISAQPLFFLRPFFYFMIVNIFGKAAVFFRLLNIFFHLGAVLAAYFLISRLSNRTVGFFASGIFAVHPIGIEAVAWISGGPYAQYGFFFIMTLLFYHLSLADKRKGTYLASIVIFLLSLFSCEKAAVLPLVLCTFMLCFGELKKQWKRCLPFFAISMIWAVIFLLQVGKRIDIQETVYSQKTGLLNPLLQVPVAITSYLGLIFWPAGLTLYHSELTFTWFAYMLRLAVFIAFLAAVIYAFKRSRPVFFWLTFFLIVLLPTLTPLGVSWIVAERYAYAASLGIFTVIAMGLERLRTQKKTRAAAYFIYSAIVISLFIRTLIRNIDWRNEDNLWIATARTSPSCPNTHNNMGDVYSRRGDQANALKEFRRAVELNPDYADAYHNLASTYMALGMPKEAEEAYKRAISLKPQLWQSYQNLSVIYFASGDYAAARYNAAQAVSINPLDTGLHNNLGVIYARLGQKDKAEEEFRASLRIQSDNRVAKALLKGLSETAKE